MTTPIPWTHRLTSTETGIARDLLWGVWRLHGDDALTRWVLATVLTELGVRLREAGLERYETTQRLIDMGGWLNTPTLQQCEPPPVLRVPWWRRWRRSR